MSEDYTKYEANGSNGIVDQTMFEVTLYGLKSAISRVLTGTLKPTAINLAFSERKKDTLKLLKQVKFPYVILNVGSFRLNTDHGNLKEISRHGLRPQGLAQRKGMANYLNPRGLAENLKTDSVGSVPIARIYPFTISVTLNYIHNDAKDLLKVAQTLLIAAFADGLNFDAVYNDYKWVVSVSNESNEISIPENLISHTSDVDPQTGALQMDLVLTTHAGTVSLVPEVKSVVINKTVTSDIL